MVLATTRSVKVAQSLSAVEPYYHLQGMSDESAWILFKKMAFGGKHQQHPNSRLEGLGQQIVKKCANVPLLIVTIASFLRYEEESKWCSLVDGEFPTVVPGDYTKVMQVLKISYREFPYPVKRCFAFCSLFPKDYDFEKNKLIRLWVAEGFIEADDVGQSLEDRAEEYFFYLANRRFFKDMMKLLYNDAVDYRCKMHDLVHDLAKNVAGSESISVDDIRAQKLETKDRNLLHVSLLGREWSSLPHPNSVRTFLRFCGGYKGEDNFLNKEMSNFKALRVLDLSSLRIKEIPTSIGKLTHLRLLNLSHNDMERLPSSICSLVHLQTLILEYCSNLKELPEEIGRLISLRHLIFESSNMSFKSMPAGLAALTSLVTLAKRVVHKPGGDLRYLECLNNLSGSLSILIYGPKWEDVVVEAQRASLSRKSRLKLIEIVFVEVPERGEEVEALMDALEPHPNLEHLKIYDFGGNKMSRWFTCLDRLVDLELFRCERVVELPPISRLRSLKKLHLGFMPSLLVIEDNISYDPELAFFPSLETLGLHGLPNLRGWWVEEPAVLPKFLFVTSVQIIGCQKLEIECMPLFEPVVEDLLLSGVQQEVVWGIKNRCSGALKSLSIFKIRGLTKMETSHLSSLQSLSIKDYAELERVCLAHLTALARLTIVNCKKLLKQEVDEDKTGVLLGHLPMLRHLKIQNVTRDTFKGFKYLTSIESLDIHGFDEGAVQWKFLQSLKTITLSFEGNSSIRGHLDGVEHLTNSLKELTLRDCTDLYLPWTSLLRLRLLQRMSIVNVERVIDVGSTPSQREIGQQLIISTSLRSMSIQGGLAEWLLGMPWMSFPSLRDLTLHKISNLEALPEGIKHLSSLETLQFS